MTSEEQIAALNAEHFESWATRHPEAKAIYDMAHGWSVDGYDSLEEAVRKHPFASAVAMHRMRDASQSYLREMPALINDGDLSEIAHHAGHVEFEMRSTERLVMACRKVVLAGVDKERVL